MNDTPIAARIASEKCKNVPLALSLCAFVVSGPQVWCTHVDLDRCAPKSWSLSLAYPTAALVVLCRTSSRAPGLQE